MKDQFIKPGEEVIFAFAIIKRDDWEKTKFPQGSYAKAYEVGPIETLIDPDTCKGWAGMAGISIGRLAVKLCPEQAKMEKLINPKIRLHGIENEPI